MGYLRARNVSLGPMILLVEAGAEPPAATALPAPTVGAMARMHASRVKPEVSLDLQDPQSARSALRDPMIPLAAQARRAVPVQLAPTRQAQVRIRASTVPLAQSAPSLGRPRVSRAVLAPTMPPVVAALTAHNVSPVPLVAAMGVQHASRAVGVT